mmetsp:Transcript_53988/g.173113  ORF Transcript_53988/g.173113 Transcript_53988/m.173113 type:complete len:302 (-) Transcript_53988:327-1232(-)
MGKLVLGSSHLLQQRRRWRALALIVGVAHCALLRSALRPAFSLGRASTGRRSCLSERLATFCDSPFVERPDGLEDDEKVERLGPFPGGSDALLDVEGMSTESALLTVRRWLDFLRGEGRRVAARLADASGYPLEQALELFAQELQRGAATVVSTQLPEGASRRLGPVGLVATVRAGEDLDLSLLGGEEWETVHLDLLAMNPLLGWASELCCIDELLGEELEGLRAARSAGAELLQQILTAAARAGRAVTVTPLNEQIKEHYRRLGFEEDAMLDPTLMFWVPTEEVVAALRRDSQPFVYGMH